MHHFPGTRRSFSAAARLVAAGVVLLASAAQAGAPVATVPVERPQVIRTVSESGGDVINAVEVVRYPAGAALRPAASVRVAAAQARPASRGKTRRRFPEEDPAVVQCVNLAAGNYRIDPTPMYLILDVERGTLGRTTQNSNGTYDMGPAQINSSWLPKLARYGISERQVTDDLCTNIWVATWIYASELHRHRGDVVEAIKHYHSPTPRHQQRYIGLIAQRSSERTAASMQPTLAAATEQ